MDILSHTFSGLAIGVTAIHFVKKSFKVKTLIVFTCGLAAFFPDLDVISFWSGFDSTLGQWFDLNQSGVDIYHQKRWYSHHAFFHSFLMAFFFTIIAILVGVWKRKGKQWKLEIKVNRVIYIAIFSSYLIHLIEDMPTPNFVWGGVAFLFPSDNYWGGKGYIWWWNNYDLFLTIFSVFCLNLILAFLKNLINFKSHKLATFILILGVSFYLKQMYYRPYNFNYQGMAEHHKVWKENEQQSKEIQKEILGKRLYNFMKKIDESIPIWF